MLKWGLAVAAGGVVGGVAKLASVVNRSIDEYEKKMNEKSNRPAMSTRIKGVKGVIESTPEIADKEMSWYKPRARQLREADFNREAIEVQSVLPRKGDRSKLHTHPYNGTNILPEHLRVRFVSNVSPADLESLVKLAENKKELRTTHVAAVDTSGKVMGYTSLRIHKNAISNEHALQMLSAIGEHYNSIFSNLIYRKDWSLLEKEWHNYNNRLQEIRKSVLLIHYTPMPGYIYKDGYFQKK